MNNSTKAAACAAVSVFLSYSSAQAIEVEYYKASVEFAREVGSCYEKAPAVLKRETYNARVIVVGDTKILSKVQKMTNAPQSDIVKFSRPSLGGGRFVAVAYRGVPGVQPRTIMFNEETLGGEVDDAFTCHTVIHEMMHLFDMGPSRRGDFKYASALSRLPEFMAAYNADKKVYLDWLAWLKVNRPDQVEMVKGRLIYFMNDPMEAFAEVGANLIAPLPDDEYRGRNSDFKNATKNMTAYMKNMLGSVGILNANVVNIP